MPDVPTPSAKRRAPVSQDGLYVYEVAKRAGSNAFGLMVTIGPTRNNDVVIEDASISKFHASLRKDADGRWSVTSSRE